ncbi:MAG: hypothetical protein JXB35_03395 [Anaerolineae bacterium]|nr:hypothetical protein [Anaerolineae bacterium]
MKFTRYMFVILAVFVLVACGEEVEPEAAPTPTPTVLVQWAADVQASSEYARPDWSAERVIGPPEIEACVDDPRAWASARGNGLEWLLIHFDQAVYATEVRIYQTFGRGALSRVHLIDEAGGQQLVWEGTDAVDVCPGVLSVSMPRTGYRISGVRIELDESRTGFWNQIDAVALIGMQ